MVAHLCGMQVEVHMLHAYGEDFHGFEVRVVVTGLSLIHI